MNNNENLFKSGPYKAASGWIRGHSLCKTRLEINDLAKTFGFDRFNGVSTALTEDVS